MIHIRLWDKYLIDVLPREQLVSQWRECSALASNIVAKGTPNHILCNFIMDYDFDHFITYAKYIRGEMTRRGYRTMDSVWNKIVALKPDWKEVSFQNLYKNKMNHEYFEICYWNLREKWLCGGFNKEMDNIEQRYKEIMKNE